MWLDFLLLLSRATGALFIFSGVGKLLARHAFLTTLRALPFLPSRSVAFVVTMLPWMAIVLGSALVMGLWTLSAAWMSLALLLGFSLVALVTVARGLDVPCSCFGAASPAPLSWKTVVRNAILAVLLLPLLVINRPSPLSMDALLDNVGTRSLTDVLLIIAVPIGVVGVTVLIATAQRTLDRLPAR